jgi:hypothetical protein
MINMVPTPCAIAYVITIENGEGTARDELRPAFKTESVPIPDSSAQSLELVITYASREEDADTTVYAGNSAPEVVVTYNNLTIYARRVRFDRRTLRIYPEGSVTVEDGSRHSTCERSVVAFEQGKGIVEMK